ncbi:MAG: hypothetical protein ACTSR1_11845 [Candidatus Heimdallarchaeota archaeon]
MAKNIGKLIFSITTMVSSILGLILFFTTSFISRYETIDNFTRIFFDGDIKTRFGSLIIVVNDSDFPDALMILGLIGLILIILGSVYTTSLAFTKKNCYISNRKAPGPVTGMLFLLGGIIGFIGLMFVVPYALDYFETFSSFTYGFGFIYTLILVILFILLGVYLLILTFTNKDKKRSSKKKK